MALRAMNSPGRIFSIISAPLDAGQHQGAGHILLGLLGTLPLPGLCLGHDVADAQERMKKFKPDCCWRRTIIP
jgi:hypothetical protein